MSWLVVIAMQPEARLLIPRLAAIQPIGGRPAFAGRLGGRDLLLVLSGVGQINAAQAATAALEARSDLEAVLSLGCAGAYAPSGLSLGQAVLAHEVVLADLGVQTNGRLYGLEQAGIPLARHPQAGEIYNRLPCDPALNDLLSAGWPGLARGTFATVGRISGDAATARAVAARWGADVEEMESGAVALVALHYGRPFAALRGISNPAGDRRLDLAAGAGAAQEVLLALEGGA